MRLAYLAPAVLGLFLVGCGNDEPERAATPPTSEQPQAPASSTVTPPADNGAATGTMQNDTNTNMNTNTETGPLTEQEPVMQGESPSTGGMNDPQTGGSNTAPATGTNQ